MCDCCGWVQRMLHHVDKHVYVSLSNVIPVADEQTSRHVTDEPFICSALFL